MALVAANVVYPPDGAAIPSNVSQTLFADLRVRFTRYPPGMAPVPRWNPNDGFFPGASGFWCNPAFEAPRVLIVGQDFGTTADYADSLTNGEDPNGPTWRALLSLMKLANLPPSHCFFTNAIVGLRAGNSKLDSSLAQKPGSNVGRSPAFKDRAFVATSADFLVHQIQCLQPSAIVLLGSPAAEVFGRIAATRERRLWASGIRRWDAETNFKPVAATVNGHAVSVIRLLHPCLREANLWRRGGTATTAAERRSVGDRVEIQLLRMVTQRSAL